MVREITFRGRKEEDLKNMEMKEFLPLIGSRQRRSLTREMNEDKKAFLKKIKLAKEGKRKKPVKTHCRDMVVVPEMLGLIIHIHNGKTFEPVSIVPEMLGHYLGEFSHSRNKVKHSAPGIGATKSSASASVK